MSETEIRRFTITREQEAGEESPLIIERIREVLRRNSIVREVYRDGRQLEDRLIEPTGVELVLLEHPKLPFLIVYITTPGQISESEYGLSDYMGNKEIRIKGNQLGETVKISEYAEPSLLFITRNSRFFTSKGEDVGSSSDDFMCDTEKRRLFYGYIADPDGGLAYGKDFSSIGTMVFIGGGLRLQYGQEKLSRFIVEGE